MVHMKRVSKVGSVFCDIRCFLPCHFQHIGLSPLGSIPHGPKGTTGVLGTAGGHTV